MRCALNKLLLAAALLAGIATAQENYSFPGRVVGKKPLDAADSVVLVDTEKPGPGRWGLYIVSNQSNQELLALDVYSEGALPAAPVLEAFNSNSAYLHFYSDYGFYHGSIKYIFDLSSSKPPVKIRYGMLALARSYGAAASWTIRRRLISPVRFFRMAGTSSTQRSWWNLAMPGCRDTRSSMARYRPSRVPVRAGKS